MFKCLSHEPTVSCRGSVAMRFFSRSSSQRGSERSPLSDQQPIVLDHRQNSVEPSPTSIVCQFARLNATSQGFFICLPLILESALDQLTMSQAEVTCRRAFQFAFTAALKHRTDHSYISSLDRVLTIHLSIPISISISISISTSSRQYGLKTEEASTGSKGSRGR